MPRTHIGWRRKCSRQLGALPRAIHACCRPVGRSLRGGTIALLARCEGRDGRHLRLVTD